MNYLAHIYLARHSDEAMIGALLGDFDKNVVPGRYPEAMEREIRIHRRVDAFTDDHPVTREARAWFHPERRRFAGVLLDVFHDHFLARTWDERCPEPLQPFLDRFYGAMVSRRHLLPPLLQEVTPRLVSQNWFLNYRELEGIRLTLTRMSRRLSRKGEIFLEGIADLEANYARFGAAFEAFFPDLERYVEDLRPRA